MSCSSSLQGLQSSGGFSLMALMMACCCRVQNRMDKCRRAKWGQPAKTPWAYCSSSQSLLVQAFWLATNCKGCSAGQDLMTSAATCNWWSVNLLSQLSTHINMLPWKHKRWTWRTCQRDVTTVWFYNILPTNDLIYYCPDIVHNSAWNLWESVQGNGGDLLQDAGVHVRIYTGVTISIWRMFRTIDLHGGLLAPDLRQCKYEHWLFS